MNQTLPDSILSVLGVKLAVLVAGFAGGVVSLMFLKDLSRKQAVMAVIVGCLFAVYMTPLVVLWLNLGPQMERGTAFGLGLGAMNLVPLFMKGMALRAQRAIASGDDKGTSP